MPADQHRVAVFVPFRILLVEHLERHVTAVADNLGTDLDRLLA